MKKTISTRFRVTKNGKVISRKMAQCHFRAKKTGTQLRRKKTLIKAHSSVIARIANRPGTL